jgi:hypothetical protein
MYQDRDWVWWNTPHNVSVEQHGLEPNTRVRVQITIGQVEGWCDGPYYETFVSGYGPVSVLPDEIEGPA